MKLSKLSMLTALLATIGANAVSINLSDLKSDFENNLKHEAKAACAKNATQIPLNKKMHFSVKLSNFGKKGPNITILNDEIASAVITDIAARECVSKNQSGQHINLKDAGKQALKTYSAEQLVAALYWLAGKVQEKTGIQTPAKLKPVVENEYVAWIGAAALKTVARASANTLINFGIKELSPKNPSNGGPVPPAND